MGRLHQRLVVRVASAGLAALVSASLLAPMGASATPSSEGTGAADLAASRSAAKANPLSPRLNALADPAVAALPAQARARAVTLPASGGGSFVEDANGRVLVTVRLADAATGTVAAVRAAGALPVHTDQSTRTVTAFVPPGRLRGLAHVPGVIAVTEVPRAATNAACPTGDYVSEGDAQLHAALARATYGVTGAGVTVGVLSDSYNAQGGAPVDVANGELPGASNPCGHSSPVVVQSDDDACSGYCPSDEGRAMAQIVHDLAPGAKLRFATADFGEADFADQIRGLAAAGATVIVDDITYYSEPMYQDGLVAKAVEDVVAQGVSYFSSAGNENEIVGGRNVGSYETLAYRPTVCPPAVLAYDPGVKDCHDFSPDAGVADATYGLSFSGYLTYVLGWNEPQYGISTDLDFYVLDHATGVVIGASTTNNFSSGATFESVCDPCSGSATSGSVDLVVARYSGTATPRFKFVSWRSGLTEVEYSTGSGGDVVGPTTFGHNASRSGATVAAVPFSNVNVLEPYSSRGPATYCWGPVDGFTPAAPYSPCKTSTVDLTATDGVITSFFPGPGASRFYGTSAAAPHAAAVAALVRQYRPCLTPSSLLGLMMGTAAPVGSAAINAKGAGRVDADAALAAAQATVTCAPSMTKHPASQAIASGTTVTLVAAATGRSAPSAIWQRSTDGGTTWTTLGAGTATVVGTTTMTSYSTSAAARYRAVFTNGIGTVASAVAIVSLAARLGVVNGTFEASTPLAYWSTAGVVGSSTSVHAGAAAGRTGLTTATTGDSTLSQTWAVPTNGGMLSFWYRDVCRGTVSTDWATATLTDNTAVTTTTLVAKRCDASLAWTQVTKSLAAYAGHSVTLRLTSRDNGQAATPTYALWDDVVVTSAPKVSVQPTSIAVPSGRAATFFAAATGSAKPAVQWQISRNGGATWANVAGATGAGTTFTVTAADNGASLRAVFANSSGTATSSSAKLIVGSSATKVAAGWTHACAVGSSSGVTCWGGNASGQLGNGTTTAAKVPTKVLMTTGVALQGALGVSAGGEHSCAVMAGGTVRCWGWNQYGQLGDGSTITSLWPAVVTGIITATKVVAGTWHTCAILGDTTLRCWGANSAGELGDGTTTDRHAPVTPLGSSGAPLSGVVGIAVGGEASCALLAGGTVACWGDNTYGQLGNGATASSSRAVTVTGIANAVSISVGEHHACALLATGTARCWGANSSGQLGDGTTTLRRTPVTVKATATTSLAGLTAVDAGGTHTCAIVGSGATAAVRCWGGNTYGQLGNGTTTSSAYPVAPSGGTISTAGATAVSAGVYHTNAVLGAGGPAAWGNNDYGQIGDGTVIGRLRPVRVTGF